MVNLLRVLLDQQRRQANGRCARTRRNRGRPTILPGIAYPATDATDRLGQLTTVKR